MIACTCCDGRGCLSCESGYVIIDRCPRQIVGDRINNAVDYVAFAERGFLPVQGGSLDQSQWFMNLFSHMQSEVAKIQEEQQEKARAKAQRRSSKRGR